MANPKLLFDNRFGDATPTASTTATGYAVSNLTDWRPYTRWKPSAMPATVTVDCTVARPVDYFLLYGQSLGGASAVMLRASTDNFTASDVAICSTNLFAYKNQLDNAYWTKTRASVTANARLNRNGLFVANKLIEDATAANSHFVGRDLGATITGYIENSATVELSADVEAGERTWTVLQGQTKALTYPGCFFNLSTGAVGNSYSGATGSIRHIRDNIYRCTIRFSVSSGAGTVAGYVLLSNDGVNTVYNGDGTSGIYLSALQMRQVASGYSPEYFEGTNNEPILLCFTAISYRYYRAQIFNTYGTTAPELAILAAGSAMEMPVPLDAGFDSVGREIIGQSNTSENGYPLGRVITREDWDETLKFQFCTWNWLRRTWLPAWNNHLKFIPFGFAWDTANCPDEVRLLMAGGNFRSPHNPGSYTDLEVPVKGLA